MISIHAPARGATLRDSDAETTLCDFNPRSRTGSDKSAYAEEWYLRHFNPRSRTGSDRVRRYEYRGVYISIHAPARGATCRKVVTSASSREFQSTLPHGERRVDSVCMSVTAAISIHAPARGATLCCPYCADFIWDFNPRSRTGSDVSRALRSCNFNPISIHAPARGATAFAGQTVRANVDFNPRSRTGSDPIFSCQGSLEFISIHAPARGATVTFSIVVDGHNISIHAPARGATRQKNPLPI